MEVQKEIERTVEIDSNYNLMRVFNAINEDRNSMTFVYNSIKFWREEAEFMTERHGKKVRLGEIVDFEEFRSALGV